MDHRVDTMKPSNVTRQTMALMRRYFIALLNRPISSLIRFIIWPGLVLAFGIYIAINAQPELTQSIALSVPAVLLFTTAFIVYSYCDWMIKDRATGIKSLMLSMGLRRCSHYLSSIAIMVLSLSAIVVTVAIVLTRYLLPDTNCPTYAIHILFIMFILQLIGFTHAAASFITSTSYSSIILVLIFLERAPSILIDLGMSGGGNWRPVLIFLDTLSPYGAIRLFIQSYALNRNSGVIDYDAKLGIVSAPTYLLILYSLIWTIIFFSFARWFEEVCPWQQDSAVMGPCFCFDSSNQFAEIHEVTDTEAESYGVQRYFEQRRNDNRDTGIRVSRLHKSFKSVPAVHDVSFNIYQGETTLLLGHNGAGKSTMMNMILGLLKPDSGRVAIKGFNRYGRSGVGVCPQTSVLDEDLTVRQHIEFFVDIKSSMNSHERQLHVEQTLDDINLTSHVNKRPAELSGGMKRKLSLGLAFVGKSDVLILDEPSSGLDPDSRVLVWDAIRRYRANRTVLLSTQHMEEADYLGDRIAIMSAGRIVCCGSSLFLTKLFGKGYKLRVECMKSKRKEILEFISKYFEDAKPVDAIVDKESLTNDNGSSTSPELSKDKVVDFVVELTTSRDAEMELIKLLEHFETNSERLGIRSHGLKSSSIEDVMLNTSKYFVNEPNQSQTKLTLNTTNNHIATLVNSNSTKGLSSFGAQVHALSVKLLSTYYNDWKNFIIYRLIIPGIAVYHLLTAGGFQRYYRPNPVGVMIISHVIYYPVLERATKFKTMQLTSQLKVTTYWFCFFILDLATLFANLITLNIILAFFLPSGTKVLKDLHLILSLALVAYFVAALAFAYMLSMIMNDHKSALGYHILIYLTSLFAWFVALLVEYALAMKEKSIDLGWVNYIGVALLPNDAYQYIMHSLFDEGYLAPSGSMVFVGGDIPTTKSKASMWFGFGALFLQTIVYTALLALAERQHIDLDYYTKFRNIYRICFGAEKVRVHQEMDPDVLEETKKALIDINQVSSSHTTLAMQTAGSQENSNSLIVANLCKSYIRGVKVVENLSFTVHTGECFGLLGINGAGKTTTFSMIVAETKPDEGRVWANGYFVFEDVDKFRKHLGYDPQASPDLMLTTYQALYLMARLRGLQERSIPMLIHSVCELLDMSEHKHKLAGNLSGGTKRKLTLGMSLIGTPRLLALDEPTAGVDPLARRGIWQLLKSLRKQNRVSIVISSHAMEECEAICDRISIMARGRLRCIGSFLHLRSKFARGCSLRIQIASTSSETSPAISRPPPHRQAQTRGEYEHIDQIVGELQLELEAAIGSSVLKLADKNVNSATFNITDNRVRRSILFRVMREFRQKHSSLSYTLNDSSLEDIFISLAREQQQLEGSQ